MNKPANEVDLIIRKIRFLDTEAEKLSPEVTLKAVTDERLSRNAAQVLLLLHQHANGAAAPSRQRRGIWTGTGPVGELQRVGLVWLEDETIEGATAVLLVP